MTNPTILTDGSRCPHQFPQTVVNPPQERHGHAKPDLDGIRITRAPGVEWTPKLGLEPQSSGPSASAGLHHQTIVAVASPPEPALVGATTAMGIAHVYFPEQVHG